MMIHRTSLVLAATAALATLSVATAFIAEPVQTASPTRRVRSIKLGFAASPSDAEKSINVPSFVASPVLAQVYPALIAHIKEYGNPNIPLGSTDGKRCKTLRRLHFQNKLTDDEVAHLTELGFRFHSFEDVYYECDFDEMLAKLIDYHEEFDTYQIPKKYDPDPELGAWVTMLRRLHRTEDLPQIEVDKLDALGFEWISTRKCGSAFMGKYREVLSYLSKVVEAGGEVRELLHEDNDIIKWVDAQRQAYENGNLSESRAEYMDELPGIDWRNPSSWA
mmetsp:Transcript_25843/g.44142  ORF Transcript_25843/g.44142 Transcript_25843/m.44142 type:complete len:277 (-) Transcript_25843:1506-2336(-)